MLTQTYDISYILLRLKMHVVLDIERLKDWLSSVPCMHVLS